ncbi:MAG: S8 family serine peptidase, partial [Gemmatimonadetes bacterium]|nr:S8 family serine peptidase [Gemmatimonadota bacterium]
MQHRTTALTMVALTLVATACVDDSLTAPPTSDAVAIGTSLSSVALTEQQVPAKHLIVFKGKAPADFEQKVAALGGTVTLNHHIGIAVVSGLDAADAPTLGKQVKATHVEEMPAFELIEPAALSQLEPVALTAEMMGSGAGVNSAANPAGAILFANQWNMQQVNAPAAWAAGRLGSPDVTVAILDTGIDYMLPDLAGLVDLSRSVSFEPIDDLYAAYYFPSRHPSTDLHYHGTNVATQVASQAWAFAGVTSGTTLMSVKVCSVLGGCHG